MSEQRIPRFSSEDEERAFWTTHDTADYFDYTKAQPTLLPNLRRLLMLEGVQPIDGSERASADHHPSNDIPDPKI